MSKQDMLDAMLDDYYGAESPQAPRMSESKIQRIQEERRRNGILAALSVAAMLWVCVAAIGIVWLHQSNPMAAYALSGLLGIGFITAGLFAGLVLKNKKVGA